MKDNTDFLLKFFNVYASKAPVNHKGPQTKANQAARWFWNNLTTEEQRMLETARSHALDCKEGHEEFDRVCKSVRQRLFK